MTCVFKQQLDWKAYAIQFQNRLLTSFQRIPPFLVNLDNQFSFGFNVSTRKFDFTSIFHHTIVHDELEFSCWQFFDCYAEIMCEVYSEKPLPQYWTKFHECSEKFPNYLITCLLIFPISFLDTTILFPLRGFRQEACIRMSPLLSPTR